MRYYLIYFILLQSIGFAQYGFKNYFNVDGDPRLSFDQGLKAIEHNGNFYILGANAEDKESYYNIPKPLDVTDTTRTYLLCINKNGEQQFYYETTYNSCSTF